MTEYEKKCLELLAKIEERLKRIEERQNKWDQIGMPDIRGCGNEPGLTEKTTYVSEETLTGRPIRYRIPCDQSQGRESTAEGC